MRVFISLLILALTGLLPKASNAQASITDSTINMFLFQAGYAGQLPAGDLSDRFGFNSNVGVNFLLKDKNNFTYSLEGSFLFGSQVEEENMLDNLKTERGAIINANGGYATVLLFERGFTLSLNFGKVINKIGPNPNSGILLKGGLGYMQHKIRIEHKNDPIPQLEGDYLKGYDRLSSGLMLKQFIGYQHLSNSRLANFFVGFEFMEGFTKSRRSFNFDTMSKDDSQRLDILMGIRAGWILPIYKRAPSDFYVY